MRILVVSNLYPPNTVGGYERLCFEVVSGLVAAGHEMTVLTSRHGGKVAEYPGQRIFRTLDLLTGDDIYAPFGGTAAERQAVNDGNLGAFRDALTEVRPDVVFAWNLFFLDAGFVLALDESGLRTIVMLTDNWLLTMRNPGFWQDYWHRSVLGPAPLPPSPTRWIERWRVQRGSRLEAIWGSAFVRNLYAAGGVRFRRERVIHNGVHQMPSADSLDRSRLIEPGSLRLLFAGRLVDLKGPDVAVRALKHLNPRKLGVQRVALTLLGDVQDAAYVAKLRTLVLESGLSELVDWAEPVAQAGLPALFASYDIYLFPSLYEPFSLTLIHALALGIPTIASDAGGNSEIVADATSGLVVPKGDPNALAAAISRLATDGALRIRLASGGKAAARRFTFDRMLGEMERYLQR